MLVPKELLTRSGYVPVTRSHLAQALTDLGVRRGGVLMVHVQMSALGWMVGGMDAVVWALRDAVGPDGTLLAFTGWEDSPCHVSSWPSEWQQAYHDQPAFDPNVSASRREFGRFPERLRTWPGAERSNHPEVSFTALGPTAHDLLTDPSDENSWGPEGPLGLNITGWVATMTDQAIAAGTTTDGTVNDCPLMLVDAPRATQAIKKWIEANF